MKNIVILGATGSIGRNALLAIDNLNKITANPHKYRVKAIVNNSDWQTTLKQIAKYKPDITILNNLSAYQKLESQLRQTKGTKTKLRYGNDEVKRLVSRPDVDVVLSAISGADGLYPTLWAIQANKTVALANKECLVMAGELLKHLKGFRKIIPVDSEHSGLFQIIHHQPSHTQIKRIILTASGGPFYNLPREKLRHVTPAQALNHPTYKMGPKITIDSATLMNKAFEIIEAYHLFNIPPDRIEVVIHPQSIIHAMVEYADGSVIAQMNQPDMRLPIQYALTYPDRVTTQVPQLCFNPSTATKPKEMALTFKPPNTSKFPALLLGYEIIRRGGTAGAVLNAANEEAVRLFLQGKISFTNITELVIRVLNKHNPLKLSWNNILEADRWARRMILNN
jgi:1-deoxy-D-xylulose-5-phosphate reductoisomerase